MVTISLCTNKSQQKLFERVPELLHSNDPQYVPPFPGTISKLLGPKSPFKDHGDVLGFIAYRDGKPVGRIAVIHNRTHNKYHNDKVGFFGFFDSINDKEVAQALFDKARSELKTRGLEALRGPYNPSINDEAGLLVDGFDSTPFVLMPYNPPYYTDLYDAVGMKQARDLYAFYISATNQAPERVEKIVKRVKRSTGVTLRNVNISRLGEELKLIRDLYNNTLCRNWGFYPVTAEDLDNAAKDLKPIVEPNLLMIAEKNGQAVGFSLAIPNINEFLHKTRGSGPVMRALKFLWFLKTRHPQDARLAAMGVHPDFRNTGIAALFYYESLMRGKQKYRGGELSWVEETNTELIKSLKVMGAEHYKTYRIFEAPTLH
ncbi:MAG: hypothetical protein R3B54_13965 [Bdellovibrionota bacterium]